MDPKKGKKKMGSLVVPFLDPPEGTQRGSSTPTPPEEPIKGTSRSFPSEGTFQVPSFMITYLRNGS